MHTQKRQKGGGGGGGGGEERFDSLCAAHQRTKNIDKLKTYI